MASYELPQTSRPVCLDYLSDQCLLIAGAADGRLFRLDPLDGRLEEAAVLPDGLQAAAWSPDLEVTPTIAVS